MSKKLALILSGVFCLIYVSSSQEVCQLDAAMTIYNKNIQKVINLLFRGSKMYQVLTDTETLNKVSVFNITTFWRGWSGKKVTRTMFLYDKDNSAAIIGDSVSTHLVRFNEKFEVVADGYKSWSGDSLQDFAVNGISPSRGVLISNYQPGYVCVYHNTSLTTDCNLMSIDLTSSDNRFSKGGDRNLLNPDLNVWQRNFLNENLKIIGIFKTSTTWFCSWDFTTSTCESGLQNYEYEESFVVFIERNNQTWHCFGKFSYQEETDCTNFDWYRLTNKTLFGCDGKEDYSTTTRFKTSLSTTSSLTTIKTTKVRPPTDDRRRNGIDWTMMALYAIMIIVMLVVGCLCISLRKEKDPHRYEKVPTKSPSTSRRPRSSGSISSEREGGKKKKKPKKKKTDTFKPRLARDLMKEHFVLNK